RLAGRYLDGLLGSGQALMIDVVELVEGRVEGGSDACPAAGDLGRELEPFGPGLAEQDAFACALDDLAQPCERHGLVVDLHLAHVDQALDEAAESELVEIDSGRGCAHASHKGSPSVILLVVARDFKSRELMSEGGPR